jgi:transposase
MLGIASGLRIFVCREVTDMRRSFEGLSALAKNVIGQDPLSGHLFVFFNRPRNCVKILLWDRSGFVIWYKRLERGTFREHRAEEIDRGELVCLLEGLDLKEFRRRKRFEPLPMLKARTTTAT